MTNNERRPNGYWHEWKNTKRELRRAIKQIGHFPTRSDLGEYGLSAMSAGIQIHGGFPAVREKMNYHLLRVPNNYYDRFCNLRRELDKIIKDNDGEFPSWGQLEDMGRSDVLGGIKKHRGINSVRKRMGYTTETKPRGYWKSPCNMRTEVRKVMKDHGFEQLPNKEVLADLGYSSLAAAITNKYPGKYRGLRKYLGQTVLRKPDGYWDNTRNTERETRAVMKEYRLKRVPSRNFLSQIDRMDLVGGIERYPRGYAGLRKKFREKDARKAAGYWHDARNAKKEAKKIITEYGELPGKKRLEEINPSLATAIVKHHGGFRKFRRLLGEEQKRVADNFWTPKNIKQEVRKFKREKRFKFLPNQKTLGELGYGYLSAAISSHYPGGFARYRRDHNDYTPGQSSEKTQQMLEIEKKIGEPLEQYLQRAYQTYGSTRIANELGLTDTTILGWLKYFGIKKIKPAKTVQDVKQYLEQSPLAQSIVRIVSMNKSYGDVAQIFTELWPDKFPSAETLSGQLPLAIPNIASSISPFLRYERGLRSVYRRLPMQAMPGKLGDLLYRIGIDVYQVEFNRDPIGTLRRLVEIQTENKNLPAKKMIGRIYNWYEGVYGFEIPGIGKISDKRRE